MLIQKFGKYHEQQKYFAIDSRGDYFPINKEIYEHLLMQEYTPQSPERMSKFNMYTLVKEYKTT